MPIFIAKAEVVDRVKKEIEEEKKENHKNLDSQAMDPLYYLLKYYSATIYPYSKAIAQGIVVDNFKLTFDEITEDELINQHKSIRGDGMLGSSGK